MKNNKFFLLFLLFTFIVAFWANGQQAAFTVQPQLLEPEIYPGAQQTFQVLLVNESDKDSNRFRIYATDFYETKEGSYKILDERTQEFSCADWIKLDTMKIALGPKSGKEIPFQIRAPSNARGGRCCAIVFELVSKVSQKEPGAGGASVVFHFRIPVYLIVTVKSSMTQKPRNVEIKGIDIKPASEDPEYNLKLKKGAENALVIKATLINRGNIHVKVKGNIILTDPKGKRLRQFPLGSGMGLILPQTTIDLISIIKRPMPGDYVAEAVVNYGGISPAIARIPFTVARKVSLKERSFLSTAPIVLNIGKEIINLAVPPNSYRTQIIAIGNEEKEPVTVKASLKYLRYDENGDIAASDSGNDRFSCISWLTIEPKQFEIPAGETKAVKVDLKVPENITAGGRYACLTMATLLSSSKDTSLPTPVQIPVMLTITGVAEKKGEITKVDVSTGNPPRFTIYFKNIGSVHLKPRVKLELKFLPETPELTGMKYIGEPKTQLVGLLTFDEFPVSVLPEDVAKLEKDYVSRLGPGSYVAVISADFGGTEPAVFVQKFSIK